jgi:hypothetical protein
MATWQNLIDRARVYSGDDNALAQSWIAPAVWLTLGNVELTILRRKWASMGLLNPATTDQSFSNAFSVAVVNALAIVGVAEIISPSTPYRVLTSSQSGWGASPVWGSIDLGSRATTWAATGFGDNFTVTLDPPDTRRNYVVRYAPNLPYATDPTTTPELPSGADERLVLGMAQRAGIKDHEASALVARLIEQQDALLMFTAFGRMQGDGPRVRRITPRVKAKAAVASLSGDPRTWRY